LHWSTVVRRLKFFTVHAVIIFTWMRETREMDVRRIEYMDCWIPI
jgi:hypothetical protein